MSHVTMRNAKPGVRDYVMIPMKNISSWMTSRVAKGYKATYLGYVQVQDISGNGCTEGPVTDIIGQAHCTDDVFLDVKSRGLLLYHVDEHRKIKERRQFDLARIPYCSGSHQRSPGIFAWIYRQETRTGFQTECHVVKMTNQLAACRMALILNRAFLQLYDEIQAALKSSELFARACRDRLCDVTKDSSMISNKSPDTIRPGTLNGLKSIVGGQRDRQIVFDHKENSQVALSLKHDAVHFDCKMEASTPDDAEDVNAELTRLNPDNESQPAVPYEHFARNCDSVSDDDVFL